MAKVTITEAHQNQALQILQMGDDAPPQYAVFARKAKQAQDTANNLKNRVEALEAQAKQLREMATKAEGGKDWLLSTVTEIVAEEDAARQAASKSSGSDPAKASDRPVGAPGDAEAASAAGTNGSAPEGHQAAQASPEAEAEEAVAA